MTTVDDLAAALLDAQARVALVAPLSTADPGFDLGAGHAVGAAITAQRRARGERTVGRKMVNGAS